ncbi:hypothetical protein JCM17844_16750 [Iodidimonas gelatinilytica]|uniref:YihY/virulence factor BrkB family protein n=1 Tax=Iodidimonas gelatinilytica TaxID=1236966 RepID=A0A5A7MSP2_9PROT|nr:YihY/virulence factor BrkB family protein [Iodidimonas gelatinilytica]GEQ98038.1 hypothetical protein JCM17844_16750 [Iodidimonas gelatinilytica]GEQ99838.1 hypothetical protein JCM17845_04620 [Iodidimonas gelatinilytica]
MAGFWQTQCKKHGQIWWSALVRFYTDHGPEHAGNMTFLGVMAIFPFLIFLISLSGLLGQTDTGQSAIAFLLSNLPQNITKTLRGPVNNIVQNSHGGVLTGSMVFALWTAIQGVEAARQTVIHAYDSWEHAAAFWRRLLADLGLVVGTALMILLAMSLLVLAPVTLSLSQDSVRAPAGLFDFGIWSRYLIAPLLLFLATLTAYKAFVPRLPTMRRYYTPGAILTVVVWLFLGKGMAIYLKNADRYDVIYGSLAGVVIFQLFVYIIASAFILGAHLNASYTRHHGPLGIDQNLVL